MRVTVTDDGRGGATVRPGGGLAGLRDRVGALGGHVDVTSPPGFGTTVTVELPVDDAGRPAPSIVAPTTTTADATAVPT